MNLSLCWMLNQMPKNTHTRYRHAPDTFGSGGQRSLNKSKWKKPCITQSYCYSPENKPWQLQWKNNHLKMYLWTKMVIVHCHVSENYMDNILPASWYGHYHIQNDESMSWPFSKSYSSLETPKFMLGFAMKISKIISKMVGTSIQLFLNYDFLLVYHGRIRIKDHPLKKKSQTSCLKVSSIYSKWQQEVPFVCIGESHVIAVARVFVVSFANRQPWGFVKIIYTFTSPVTSDKHWSSRLD